MHLRGPMNISQLAVYQLPSDMHTLSKRNTVPFYNRQRRSKKRDADLPGGGSFDDNDAVPLEKRTFYTTENADCGPRTVTMTVNVTECPLNFGQSTFMLPMTTYIGPVLPCMPTPDDPNCPCKHSTLLSVAPSELVTVSSRPVMTPSQPTTLPFQPTRLPSQPSPFPSQPSPFPSQPVMTSSQTLQSWQTLPPSDSTRPWWKPDSPWQTSAQPSQPSQPSPPSQTSECIEPSQTDRPWWKPEIPWHTYSQTLQCSEPTETSRPWWKPHLPSRPLPTGEQKSVNKTSKIGRRDTANWSRAAYYNSAAPAQATGFSFLANRGDPQKSGTFD